MKHTDASFRIFRFAGFLILLSSSIYGQPNSISQYVIFGGNAVSGTPPSTGVYLGFNIGLPENGNIGSPVLIQTTDASESYINLYSWGNIILADDNFVMGNIVAGNSNNSTDTVVRIGNNAYVNNIDANGLIRILSGTVNGQVTTSAA